LLIPPSKKIKNPKTLPHGTAEQPRENIYLINTLSRQECDSAKTNLDPISQIPHPSQGLI
jgi:hypothetical protein